MSRLFHLKEWVSVADAAQYLSISLGESVSEPDILRLALDGHLTLSVYLPNGATVTRGKIVTHSLAEVVAAMADNKVPDGLDWVPMPKSLAQKGYAARPDDSDEDVPLIISLRVDDSRWITLDRKKIVSVWELWDLPMFGGERLDVEHEYQRLTGGPSITAETLDGAFIWRGPESICQIQADFDDNEHVNGSKADGVALERRIIQDEIGKEEASKLRADFDAKRKKYKDERKQKEYCDNFYPSGGLPEDSVFVVRTTALRDFEQSFGGTPKEEEKPLSSRERDTLLTLIAAMAKEGYKHDPTNKARSAVSDILTDVQKAGLSISDQTIRDKLKDAWELLPGNPHKT